MGIQTLQRLAEISGWGLRIFISLTDVSISVRDFYDNIKMSQWETLTTGYLDPNAYKKGKGKATSQIELKSQNGQMEQRPYANSTLNITNGEAVSHHYSYDRQAQKEMGSTTRTAKTQKQGYSCPFRGQGPLLLVTLFKSHQQVKHLLLKLII